MCEWLSCGEWCDVQLVCGGRAFNAHKAVLASVSSFLRETLLSCDDIPTVIVLPDFDVEAMSSVLYYIYNGEVIIQKQKLEVFIDIVKAMQIFIDQQCFQKLQQSIENSNLNLSFYHKSKCIKIKDVFSMSTNCSKNQQYVNLKKGERIPDVNLQYTLSDLDIHDKQRRCKKWNMLQSPLENLSSPYADRQRNTFLRDLFIETYPRNGNANGLTSSVLAISNERYRAPTSVLLTNANGKYPRTGDALSDISIRTTEYASFMQSKRMLCTQKYDKQFETYPKDDRFISSPSDAVRKIENRILTATSTENPWTNISMQSSLSCLLPVPQLLPSLDLSKSPSSIEARTNPYFLTYKNSLTVAPVENSGVMNLERSKCVINNRVSVLNQVMESPWCPRLPKDYRPFHKKTYNEHKQNKQEESQVVAVNDDNNNVQQTTKASETDIELKFKVSSNCSEEFKCIICSQVFFTQENLTVHTSTCRQPVTARYTCGECGKTFSQLRNFKYHMSVHRGTREFAATCTVCGKYFNDRGYLSSHMKIHRNRKEYKCTMCPKSFNQRVAYNMHVRIHTGVKPHVCEQCGKAFSRKMLLKQHQRTHSGERPYACSHCDKRFADRSNMTLHLRLHTGVKPFSCTLCPKSFTKKHHLKSHLNFHTGAKPYSCPRCKLAFTQSSNMRTHFKKCNAPDVAEQTMS